MTMILTNTAQLGLHIETTEGTKATLAATDFIPVANPKFTPSVTVTDMKKITGSLSPSAGRPGMRSGKISFDYYLRGAAAAGTLPEIDTALQACGLTPTIVAITSVTYTPAPLTITPPSVTIEIQEGGKIKRLWGARGNAKVTMKSGTPIMIAFEFTGCDFEEVDGAKTAGVTFSSLAEPVFMGTGLTIGAFALTATAINLDLANTVTLRGSLGAASGNLSAMITGRNPAFTIDPEEVLVAEYDQMGAWRNGTTMALATLPIGTVAGNKITFSAPAVQYGGVTSQDRGGIAALSINAHCCRLAGDDEISLAFT